MKKYFFLIAVSVFTLLPLGVLAEGEAERGAGPRSYAFHLLFDNGKISLDADFAFPYSFFIEPYVPPLVPLQYRGEVLSFKNTPLARFTFDPKQEEHNFTKGKITVKAPYFPDAAKVIFYDNTETQTLIVPVAKTAICNDNSVCNADYGENNANCPQDCKNILAPPLATPSSIAQPTPQASSFWSVGAISALSGLFLVLFLLLLVRIKRR